MLDTIVVLKVGLEKEEIRVHKGLLCETSPYFRAALQGGFKEAQDQTIEWPEEDPKITKIFQLWLYSGILDFDAETLDESAWSTLVDLYGFAEPYDLPALKNSVMDIVLSYVIQDFWEIPWLVFNKVYSVTSPKAPLRQLLIDLAVHRRTRSWEMDEPVDTEGLFLRHFPKEYLVDVMLAEFDHKGSKEPGIGHLRGAHARYMHV